MTTSDTSAEFSRLAECYHQIPEFYDSDYNLSAKYAETGATYWFYETEAGFINGYNRIGGDSAPAGLVTPDVSFYIWLMGVYPHHRGRRDGRCHALFQAAVDEARRRGLATVTVKTHSNTPGMIRALLRFGFELERATAVQQAMRVELYFRFRL